MLINIQHFHIISLLPKDQQVLVRQRRQTSWKARTSKAKLTLANRTSILVSRWTTGRVKAGTLAWGVTHRNKYSWTTWVQTRRSLVPANTAHHTNSKRLTYSIPAGLLPTNCPKLLMFRDQASIPWKRHPSTPKAFTLCPNSKDRVLLKLTHPDDLNIHAHYLKSLGLEPKKIKIVWTEVDHNKSLNLKIHRLGQLARGREVNLLSYQGLQGQAIMKLTLHSLAQNWQVLLVKVTLEAT